MIKRYDLWAAQEELHEKESLDGAWVRATDYVRLRAITDRLLAHDYSAWEDLIAEMIPSSAPKPGSQ